MPFDVPYLYTTQHPKGASEIVNYWAWTFELIYNLTLFMDLINIFRRIPQKIKIKFVMMPGPAQNTLKMLITFKRVVE